MKTNKEIINMHMGGKFSELSLSFQEIILSAMNESNSEACLNYATSVSPSVQVTDVSPIIEYFEKMLKGHEIIEEKIAAVRTQNYAEAARLRGQETSLMWFPTPESIKEILSALRSLSSPVLKEGKEHESFEKAKLALRDHILNNKEQVLSDLLEMRAKSDQGKEPKKLPTDCIAQFGPCPYNGCCEHCK